MSPGAILVLVVAVLLAATLPIWPYARSWGYRPAIALGVLFTFLAVLVAVRII